ncbi:Uu.00g047580.m01.CDS01 [Anthostomella pinea]|uniref:Uu.00g047580.m01.CDS01 n=1 Tax=Anthostomella pinea TaxID=933095 RepID=A0AAI8VBJ7_9PEZI|nr:Uu.00g047580.m01.CDS01 [Anthostomella pinea]
MPLTSDLTLDASKFDPKAIAKETTELNDKLMKKMEGQPRWWEVGAEKYRQMRWNGETPLPKPVVLDSGKNIELSSRDQGRKIPCRVFHPENGKPKGNTNLANDCQLVVISVGYRLAPENPYPAPNKDCYDVGEYLVDNAEKDYGAPLLFMTGGSAGAHLSVVTCYHLLKARPDFAFKGLILNFGAYDLSGFLPQAHHFDLPLVFDVDSMHHFIEAHLSNTTPEQRRDPMMSPFFADLTEMKLPSALFTVGTLDCLMDDSVFMSAKWSMAGAESILKVYPGAPYGFVFFPPKDSSPEIQESLDDIHTYIKERM